MKSITRIRVTMMTVCAVFVFFLASYEAKSDEQPNCDTCGGGGNYFHWFQRDSGEFPCDFNCANCCMF